MIAMRVLCEIDNLPETDDDPIVDCEWRGPVHLSCHTRVCTSAACHKALGLGE